MARPSIYATQVKPKLKFIQPLIDAGFPQKDIAAMLGINEDTLYEFKKKYKEFSECFKKDNVVRQIEDTLVNRLTGEYKATKKVYEPDPLKPGMMRLTKIEEYEVPFKESAYFQYLARIDPDKWGDKPGQGVDDIITQFCNAVNKVSNDRQTNTQIQG